MDTSIKQEETKESRKPLALKCSADGKHFAQFPAKRCSHCVPIYDKSELKKPEFYVAA